MARRLAGALFAVQFVLLDAVLRGPHGWLVRPRVFVSLVESVLLWTVVLVFATTRRARIAASIVAAFVFVLQVFVHRYYRTPLDVQVAASAIHAWRDVEPVLVRALPSVIAATVVLGALEYALLRAAPPAPARRSLALGGLAFAGLFGVPPRDATPELRAVHALRAVAQSREPVVSGAVALPPLLSERPVVPSVLFVLSESIRQSDYVTSGDGATAPEITKLPGKRFDLRQMRSVASYTAVSLSALVTGRSQEAPREDILRSPSLFDLARATHDGSGRRPFVGYFSAQLRDIFETKDVWAAADRMRALEDLLGKELEEADQPTVDLPLDKLVVDEMNRTLDGVTGPAVVVLHFGGTHAPYYCDPTNAPFQPVVHYASWRDMAMLHNAYKNAIHHQDRALASAVRAFVDRAHGPWMVVFTSDHGDAFAEHGAIHHGQNLYDEQVHVPAWILVGEGTLTPAQERALGEHEQKFVTHLDVLPTVLDAMGLWDNSAVAPHRAKMAGRSLLRPYEPRGPIPVTNCTTMFPCPLNTWGVYEDDHKLVAHIWDGAWECLVAGGDGNEEKVAPPGDETCPRLAEISRRHFPLLPNGTPNR